MATKKVVKKSSKVFLLAVLLGVVAIAAFLLPFVRMYSSVTVLSITTTIKSNVSGFALAFGSDSVKISTSINDKVTTATGSVEMVVFALISFIAIALGVVASASNLVVDKKIAKIVNLVACVLFVAGAVFAVLSFNQYLVANFADSEGNVADLIKDKYSLGFGAYISAACSGLACLVSAYKIVK